ncbi:MAG: hypothetical protein K6E33_03175 [Lachnospiraceae bacterium]|nr:hypothetical protein [Lachnospiraceae bacterium]
MSIPVIFTGGNYPLLRVTAAQAAKFNSTVYIINNDKEHDCRDILDADRIVPWDSVRSEKIEHFARVYKNITIYGEWFNYTSNFRYLVTEAFMRERGFEYALQAEHDVMDFTDFSELQHIFDQGYVMALHDPERKKQGYLDVWAGQALWSLDALSDFNDWCIDMYENHFEELKERSRGNICDMSTNSLWQQDYVKKHGEGLIYNMSRIRDNGVFDHNLCADSETEDSKFQFHEVYRLKKWVMKDGVPYFISEDGQLIRALTMHFNGQAKQLLTGFAETDGNLRKMLNTPEGRKYKASCHKQFRNRIVNGVRRRLPGGKNKV